MESKQKQRIHFGRQRSGLELKGTLFWYFQGARISSQQIDRAFVQVIANVPRSVSYLGPSHPFSILPHAASVIAYHNDR